MNDESSLLPNESRSFSWSRIPWEQLLIWGLFLLTLYVLRHFFFIMLMTFLIAYAVRTVVSHTMQRFVPDGESLWIDRLLTLGCYLVLVLILVGSVGIVAPRLVSQGHGLLGRLTKLSPTSEFNNILNRTVGAYLFRRDFGDESDPRFQQGMKEFEEKGIEWLREYQTFPQVRAQLEGAFEQSFQISERRRLQDQLGDSGGSDAFDQWFLTVKAPQLFAADPEKYVTRWEAQKTDDAPKDQANSDAKDTGKGTVTLSLRDQEIRQEILQDVRNDPKTLDELQDEWTQAELDKRLTDLRRSPQYKEQFQEYFEKRRAQNPSLIPFSFEEYLRLKEAYPKGQKAFADAIGATTLGHTERTPEQESEDFRLAQQEQLAQKWWASDPMALTIRQKVSDDTAVVLGWIAARLQVALAGLLTIPVELSMALVLSIFITFDFANLRNSVRRLSDHPRVGRFVREIVPGLVQFARLIGRSFQAQAVIACFNTLLTFIALWLIGVENEVFLCTLVFICSFIPVWGVIFSSIPIALMALVQTDGSLLRALLSIVAILVIHLIESTILNPKIMGNMAHMHPVMVTMILAIGEYFFGMWGLLLGVPVAVYIIRIVILNEDIPGVTSPSPHHLPPPQPS